MKGVKVLVSELSTNGSLRSFYALNKLAFLSVEQVLMAFAIESYAISKPMQTISVYGRTTDQDTRFLRLSSGQLSCTGVSDAH